MSSTSSNLDLVRGVYRDFAAGNVPGVLGALHDDIAWTEAEGFPYGGTYHGPQAVLDHVFVKLGTEWDGFQAVPEDFVDGGDTVVVLGTYSGTYKATGRHMRVPLAHVWKLRDGKAVQFRQFTDTALVQRALVGAGEAAAAA